MTQETKDQIDSIVLGITSDVADVVIKDEGFIPTEEYVFAVVKDSLERLKVEL